MLLRDPLDDNVVPVVADLRRRLRPVNSNREDNEVGKELAVQHDVETGEEDGISYFCIFDYLGTVLH